MNSHDVFLPLWLKDCLEEPLPKTEKHNTLSVGKVLQQFSIGNILSMLFPCPF